MSISHLISARSFYETVETAVVFAKKITLIERAPKAAPFGIGPDSRFAVAIKTLQEMSLWEVFIHLLNRRAYVKIEHEGQQPLLVKVNEVASRLYIKKEKVLEAAQQGTLAQLITTNALKMQQVFAKYDEIVKQHKDRYATDLANNKEVILKTIEQSIKTNKPLVRLAGKNHFEMGVLGKFIGKGSFGRVSKVTTYTYNKGKFSKREEALKCARQKFKNLGRRQTQREQMRKHATNDIKNEKKQLDKLPNRVWGLQIGPREVGEVTIETPTETKQKFGYIDFEYDHNYANYIDSNQDPALKFNLFPNCLQEFHQILHGLCYLNQHELLHGDVKTENVLRNETLVHIADMGGVCDAKETWNIEKLSGVTRSASPVYSVKEDLLKACEIVEKAKKLDLTKEENRRVYQQLRREIIELEQKRAIFAGACVLYKRLTGHLPFEKFDPYGFPILSTYQELTRADIPLEFSTLLKEMLSTDYKKRPAHVFRIYEEMLSQRFPQQLAEIRAQKIAFEK